MRLRWTFLRPGDRGRAASVAALLAAACGALLLAAAVTSFVDASAFGYDFAAYHAAARRLVAGEGAYQPETLGAPFRPGPGGLYLYAPPLAAALTPLARLDIAEAARLWLGLKLVLFVAACALLPVSRRVRLAVFGVAALSLPVLSDLNLGNVSLVVLFVAVLGWRWRERPAGPAAIGAGMLLRPTLALLPLSWLLERCPRATLWALAGVLVTVLVTAPAAGLGSYLDYLRVLANVHDVTGVPRSVDLGSAALLAGAPPALAQIALYAGYAIAVAAVGLALRRRDGDLTYQVTLGASLLLSPLLWAHYLSLLVLPAAFLAGRGRRWGIALPLLGWLPEPLLAIGALTATLAPFAAPQPARQPDRQHDAAGQRAEQPE